MPTMSCKQKGLLKRVTKNVMNMRKLFNSSKKKEDSWYDPDKVTNDTKDKKDVTSISYQGCPLLELLVEPCMLDMVCDYLDVWSISRLEECCHLLRGLVVENKLYRRRVKRIVCLRTPGDWIQEDWEDEGDSLETNSRYYKSKLFGYEYR